MDKSRKLEETAMEVDTPKSPQPTQIEKGKMKKLECPFKSEDPAKICRLTEKQKSDRHDFKKHLFLHYRMDQKEWIASHWNERLKNLEKGDQLSMFCDSCTIRKKIIGVTENGLRNSMVCHLALSHGELVDVMKKDEHLTQDFIDSVFFYNEDLKKLQESSAKYEKIIEKNRPSKTEENANKPDPKPTEIVTKKKKSKKPLSNDHDDIPDISSDEPDVWPQHQIKKQPPTGSASKKTLITKSKPRSQKSPSPDPVMRTNQEVIRKRRPINFTVDDLDDDKDESFTRNNFDSSDSNTDDEEFQNLSKMTTAQLNAVTYNKVNQSGEPSGRKRKIVNYKDFEFEKNKSDEDF